MRPTFMGFEAAKSSIFANQKSLDIVGNNLSNTNTAGYTRQRVARVSVSPSTSSRLAGNRVGLAGQGVEALGVSQTRDSFLDKRFRDEYAKATYHGQTNAILNSVQVALGDGADITDESGLMGALTQVYESLNEFAKDPTTESQATLVMSSFKNITQVLNQMSTNLDNVVHQFTEDLVADVSQINDISAKIAHLNDIIANDSNQNTEFGPNELLDARNLLIDELGSYGDIVTTELENGVVNITMGGHELVNDTYADKLHLSVNTDDTIKLQWVSDGSNLSTTNGTLMASVHHLNGKGQNVQSNTEEPYQGIPYYKDQLDTYARALADVANHTVPELGTDGTPKLDADGKIIYKTLLGGKQANGATSTDNVTADNIAVSDEWSQAGASYFIFNVDERVEDYALQLATQLTSASYTFNSYGETYEGSFADFEVALLGKVGTDISFHSGRQESYAKVADSFLGQRDSVSGVNSDEETADMLMFQKSYEASARVMTVLDELLDVVINRMGA